MKEKQLYLFGPRKNEEKADSRFKIILPLDTLILLSAAMIILFTVSFSLGVERGRRITLYSGTQGKEKVETKKIGSKPTITEKKEENRKAAIKDEESEKYHIQVASFQKEGTAKTEAKTLKEAGFPVLVSKKGKYAVVYVGEFDSETEAKNMLRALKKRYKDCILRKLCRK